MGRRPRFGPSKPPGKPNSAHGFQCYYVPLRAGGLKTYSNDYNSFVCCHGTGMESNTKFGDTIYFHDVDVVSACALQNVRRYSAVFERLAVDGD